MMSDPHDPMNESGVVPSPQSTVIVRGSVHPYCSVDPVATDPVENPVRAIVHPDTHTALTLTLKT
jgi:hypothetical protein